MNSRFKIFYRIHAIKLEYQVNQNQTNLTNMETKSKKKIKMKSNLLKLAILILFYSCGSARNEFNILDFGAVGDGTTLNTKSVQKAIDRCAENGGKVVVPSGNFVIGTIILKSNVELHITEGGNLLGSISLVDYSTTNQGSIEAPAFNKCLVYAENATNIKITGKGIINGRGFKTNFPEKIDGNLGERPMLMRFINCKDVHFSDITFMNSASWCTHMIDCDSVILQNVSIDCHVNINNDGFDLDGCRNVLIENCNIRSDDDAICLKSTTTRLTENIIVRNCRAVSHTSAFKCGTSSRGGFKNISITDCDFSDSRVGVIKLMVVDGGILEDVTISNIKMENVEGPIFIRLGNRGRKYDVPTEQIYKKEVESEGAAVGSVKNITIRNIKANVISDNLSRNGIMISGIPGHYIENVSLEDIEISYPGGGTVEDSKKTVAEDIARYPEQFFFGTLPSWGAFIRHARNIEFKNVTMSTRTPDFREKIVLNDVQGFLNR
jgi:polygalacturonase